jgi:putative Holliday junction resolvase
MRVLGIDLGTKTMGLAISDPLRIIASGVSNFTHDSNYDSCVNEILRLIDHYKNVDTVLIGNPIKMDGRESMMSKIISDFKNKLLAKIPSSIKIILFDERYSTKIAMNQLKNKYGNNYQKIKDEKDKMSAIVLVQEYINN